MREPATEFFARVAWNEYVALPVPRRRLTILTLLCLLIAGWIFVPYGQYEPDSPFWDFWKKEAFPIPFCLGAPAVSMLLGVFLSVRLLCMRDAMQSPRGNGIISLVVLLIVLAGIATIFQLKELSFDDKWRFLVCAIPVLTTPFLSKANPGRGVVAITLAGGYNLATQVLLIDIAAPFWFFWLAPVATTAVILLAISCHMTYREEEIAETELNEEVGPPPESILTMES